MMMEFRLCDFYEHECYAGLEKNRLDYLLNEKVNELREYNIRIENELALRDLAKTQFNIPDFGEEEMTQEEREEMEKMNERDLKQKMFERMKNKSQRIQSLYKKKFIIEMFGLNEKGETVAIFVDDFSPFFFVKVNDDWEERTRLRFLTFLTEKINMKVSERNKIFVEEKCQYVEKFNLYGFDNYKLHKFLRLEFTNIRFFHQVKSLWFMNGDPSFSSSSSSSSSSNYDFDVFDVDEMEMEQKEKEGSDLEFSQLLASSSSTFSSSTSFVDVAELQKKEKNKKLLSYANSFSPRDDGWMASSELNFDEERTQRKLKPEGLMYAKTNTRIYEGNIPPLLRYFHLSNISPSGWIRLLLSPNKGSPLGISPKEKHKQFTTCDYEFEISQECIESLPDKSNLVPYKILSFDIEASSLDGSFPLPVKTYRQYAISMIDWIERETKRLGPLYTSKKFVDDFVEMAHFMFGFQSQQPEQEEQEAEMTKEGEEKEICEDAEPIPTSTGILSFFPSFVSVEEKEEAKKQKRKEKEERQVHLQNSFPQLKMLYERQEEIDEDISKILCHNLEDGKSIDSEIKNLVKFESKILKDYVRTKTKTQKKPSTTTTTGSGKSNTLTKEEEEEKEDSPEEQEEEGEEGGDNGEEGEEEEKEENEEEEQMKEICQKMNIIEFDEMMETGLEKAFRKIGSDETIVDFLFHPEYSTKEYREMKILTLNMLLTSYLRKIPGDMTTFIGSTFLNYGEKEPYRQHCISLGSCQQPMGDPSICPIEIESYEREKDVLLAWTKLVQQENPDMIIGYNIFGFDYNFLFHRAKELNCLSPFLSLSRNKNEICAKRKRRVTTQKNEDGEMEEIVTYDLKLEDMKIKLASGEYDLNYIKMPGRLQIDLLNYFRRGENLVSYKLDYVSGYFIGDYVKSLIEEEKTPPVNEASMSDQPSNSFFSSLFCQSRPSSSSFSELTKEEEEEKEKEFAAKETWTKITTSNLMGLKVGNYIHFEEIGHSVEYYANGAKFQVVQVDALSKSFWIAESNIHPDMLRKKVKWCLAKDDVTPKHIFEWSTGATANESTRAVVAKYCVADCNLVQYLNVKCDIITDFVEMANVCSVPMNYLVMRGQGIKLTSYISKKCLEKGFLMPMIDKGNFKDAYEGAIVLEPKTNLYLTMPIACVDYGSLYPSCIISENFSHDTKLWTKTYDLKGKILYVEPSDANKALDNLPGFSYVDCEYDLYEYRKIGNAKRFTKVKTGKRICRFVQNENEVRKGIMPAILEELLAARKATRKAILTTSDEFMKNVLDKRQLAYKVTANSLYGQCGAKTSTFYEQDIAASTTATGRKLIIYAKTMLETNFHHRIMETSHYSKGTHVETRAEYIYGDTDSVFFTFNLCDPLTKEKIEGQEALAITIELAQQASHEITSFLKKPHDLEYEKTFLPFCLLSKKRYVGMLYEMDPKKCKGRKEMGIVLKRRDNSPCVKDFYGGVIDILMKQQSLEQATQFLQEQLRLLLDGNIDMEKLIISKSLRSNYKNPLTIAHKVLANRIAEREPGNAPGPGDRIPYVYIQCPPTVTLQGDKIETPEFIIERQLPIDYPFYVTNQIMKPLLQVFSLVLPQLWDLYHVDKQKQQMFFEEISESINKVRSNYIKLKMKKGEVIPNLEGIPETLLPSSSSSLCLSSSSSSSQKSIFSSFSLLSKPAMIVEVDGISSLTEEEEENISISSPPSSTSSSILQKREEEKNSTASSSERQRGSTGGAPNNFPLRNPDSLWPFSASSFRELEVLLVKQTRTDQEEHERPALPPPESEQDAKTEQDSSFFSPSFVNCAELEIRKERYAALPADLKVKIQKKIQQLFDKQVQEILFDPLLPTKESKKRKSSASTSSSSSSSSSSSATSKKTKKEPKEPKPKPQKRKIKESPKNTNVILSETTTFHQDGSQETVVVESISAPLNKSSIKKPKKQLAMTQFMK